MTTQTCKAYMMGPDFAVGYTATCTDDQWNEIKSETGTLSLGRTMRGKIVKSIVGYYTAGGGMLRVRNLVTNETKEILALPKRTAEKFTILERPIPVDQDDVLEVFCVAVPT